MPTFAVHIKVAGPLRDMSDGKRFAGAYSHRFVTAADAETARKRALEGLLKERQFAQLRPEGGIGPPLTEVDTVREASWLEGLMSKEALVLCRETPRSKT